MNQIKEVLGSFDISAPILRRLLPGNQSEKYEQAVEDVAFAVQKRVRKRVLAAQKAGKDIKVGTRLYKEVIQEMIRKGEINKKGGLKLFGYSIIDETLEAREHGGPVHTGKAYVVGEAGPEIMIPKSSGNVVANDDSQVFAMLLASNPQLQKVSKERAMKILKAKFPEYFD
jgi:phage-related minor tail protein